MQINSRVTHLIRGMIRIGVELRFGESSPPQRLFPLPCVQLLVASACVFGGWRK